MKNTQRAIRVLRVPNPQKKAEAMILLMRTIDTIRNENKNLILSRRKEKDEKTG